MRNPHTLPKKLSEIEDRVKKLLATNKKLRAENKKLRAENESLTQAASDS